MYFSTRKNHPCCDYVYLRMFVAHCIYNLIYIKKIKLTDFENSVVALYGFKTQIYLDMYKLLYDWNAF